MNNKMLLMVGVVVLVLAGGYLVMSSNKQPAAAPESTTVTETTPAATDAMEKSADATQAAGGDVMEKSVKEVTVTGSPFKFDPPTITVKKGDTVKLTFKNAAGMHDWMLDEFNARTKQLKAGEEEAITFVADKAGSFEYYCSVGNHRAMGMKGTLVVE